MKANRNSRQRVGFASERPGGTLLPAPSCERLLDSLERLGVDNGGVVTLRNDAAPDAPVVGDLTGVGHIGEDLSDAEPIKWALPSTG